MSYFPMPKKNLPKIRWPGLVMSFMGLALVVLVGMGCGETGEEQDAAGGLRIVGTVTCKTCDTPIENAKVLLMGSGIAAVYTSSDGEFRIEDVPAGTYNLEITHAGHKDVIETVTIDANDQPTYVTVTMDEN